MSKLLTIEQASKLLNVPKGSLRAAAEEHGFLVRIGKAVRIDQDQLGDLVEKCKVPPIPRAPQETSNLRHNDVEPIVIRYTKGAEEVAKELKKKGRKT